MSQYNDGPVKTLRAAGTIPQYARIKLDTNGDWALAGAGAGGKADAIALHAAVVGDMLAGRLLNVGGTVKVIASEALTLGELIYGAANGKVDDLTTNCLEGKALEAAGADGDIIEMLIMNTSAVTL
jgi:hypothetical protein